MKPIPHPLLQQSLKQINTVASSIDATRKRQEEIRQSQIALNKSRALAILSGIPQVSRISISPTPIVSEKDKSNEKKK